MIIETRYRDVPWEEVVEHFDDFKPTREDWDRFRGKPLLIETPGHENTGPAYKCKLLYKIAGEWTSVCPHIAEIGD